MYDGAYWTALPDNFIPDPGSVICKNGEWIRLSGSSTYDLEEALVFNTVDNAALYQLCNDDYNTGLVAEWVTR